MMGNFKFVSLKDMRERYGDMLAELLDVDDGLTEKEIWFLEKLDNWDGAFTVDQAKWLTSIWGKVFG